MSVTIDPGSPQAAVAVAAARRLVTARFAASSEGDGTPAPTPSAQSVWDAESAAVTREVFTGDPRTVATQLAYLLWAMTDVAFDLTQTALVLVHGRHGDRDALRGDGAAAEAMMEVLRCTFAPDPSR